MHPAVHSHSAPPPPGEASLRSLGRLFPYLWEFRGRVLLALALLIGAKLASVAVPLVLKEIIESGTAAADERDDLVCAGDPGSTATSRTRWQR